MSCANCTTTISDTLTSLEGASDTNVNFATDEGIIEFNHEQTSLEETYNAVESAEYSAERRSVTVGISDITCADPASTNEQVLDDGSGVIEAMVSFATDEARVEYNPADVSVDDLYNAIEDADYQPVREPESDAAVLSVIPEERTSTYPESQTGDNQ